MNPKPMSANDYRLVEPAIQFLGRKLRPQARLH
jgi:hypothetical protein